MSTSVKIKQSGAELGIALLKGAMLIVFGVWLLKSLSENLAKLSVIFGILILIGGVFEIGAAFNNRKKQIKWEWTLTSGILDILLGAFLVANPAFILLLITAFISVWLLIRGVIIIRQASILKKINNANYRFNLVLGIILIILAVIFVWHPEVLGITLAFWTALAFISLGIFRIVVAYRFRNTGN